MSKEKIKEEFKNKKFIIPYFEDMIPVPVELSEKKKLLTPNRTESGKKLHTIAFLASIEPKEREELMTKYQKLSTEEKLKMTFFNFAKKAAVEEDHNRRTEKKEKRDKRDKERYGNKL